MGALIFACYGGEPASPTFGAEPPGSPSAGEGSVTDDSPALGYTSCPSDSPAACPSPAPSWATTVEPIVNRRCALGGQCHGAGGAEQSMYDYTTYAGVKKSFVTMESDLLSCKMPPSNAVAPTLDERVTLLTWFVCGAPNN